MIFLEFTKDLFFKFEKILNIRHIFCPGEVGGGGLGGGVRAFEHFFPCPLVPNLGILTTNFAPNCGFLKPRKGYFIRFKVFFSPNGEEFDSKNCNFYVQNQPPSPWKHLYLQPYILTCED